MRLVNAHQLRETTRLWVIVDADQKVYMTGHSTFIWRAVNLLTW